MRQLRAAVFIALRQGLIRKTRGAFWRNLWQMQRHNPGGVVSYITVCAQAEHFLEYRGVVREQIERQLSAYLAEEGAPSAWASSPIQSPDSTERASAVH